MDEAGQLLISLQILKYDDGAIICLPFFAEYLNFLTFFSWLHTIYRTRPENYIYSSEHIWTTNLFLF